MSQIEEEPANNSKSISVTLNDQSNINKTNEEYNLSNSKSIQLSTSKKSQLTSSKDKKNKTSSDLLEGRGDKLQTIFTATASEITDSVIEPILELEKP